MLSSKRLVGSRFRETVKLEGKIAIVTGCNSEFGSAIVPGFAAEGCDIACVDFKQPDADRAAEKVKQKGRRSLAIPIDLRKRGEIESMVSQVIDSFGRIDILVNTTMASHNQEFLNFKEEDFDDSLSRGVKSYFLTCQAVARQMVKQRYGKIINLSSIVGVLGPGQAASWTADRGAVNGLTRAAAHALGFYGINVNAVARGNTARKPYSKGVIERVRRLPLGRTETPEDMVEPCVFLASDGASYITGTILYVDGGYTVAGVTDDRYRPQWARAGADSNE
ncbi:MAG TPA: SDR family oxidoreductase [Candidatus Binatia bacterium]|nr:SDR family oxidoreductase [Candidatus Binatia bacterium]